MDNDMDNMVLITNPYEEQTLKYQINTLGAPALFTDGYGTYVNADELAKWRHKQVDFERDSQPRVNKKLWPYIAVAVVFCTILSAILV